MKAIGVTRVSTDEQGLSLEAQRSIVTDECDRKLWELVDIHTDVISSRYARPELNKAIARIEAGEAQVLVVAKLDRLCRSTQEFCELLERSLDNGWTLHITDLGVDLTTAMGKMIARVLASFAEFERDMISQRTKEALAALKAQGKILGRPRVLSDAIANSIIFQRDECNWSWPRIAEDLNREGLKPAQAQEWSWDLVRSTYRTRKARAPDSNVIA
jgi:DNA invertase Pin-like site-specific DNA recombinase